ncbi:MAG TPA: hypothetical protein VL307_02680 [Chitinophagaceae bacterium]|nr:hypothetical protein [Chitinophagaceae bacterium]
MTLIKTLAVTACLASFATAAYAQRIKVTEGDLSALKGEKSISIVFTYDNMRVGKFKTEAEYISKKSEEYDKKEAGRGARWAKDWVDDRKDKYEPKFIELFEKASDMVVKKDAKYTMVYNTNYTEPGFNVAVMRHNAETNADVTIMETATKKVVAKLTVEKALGRTFWGADYETGGRIAECYADAGKALGVYIRKSID